MKILILMLLPSLAMADIEYKVSQLDYRLWDAAKFPVTLHTIGYIKNVNGFTFGSRYGQSNTRGNEYNNSYSSLEKRISRFWSFSGGYSYFVSGFNLGAGINYTEYKEEGEYPNSDTGNGYYISADYRINQDYSIGLSKDTYYKKYKAGYGKETTNGVGVYLTYAGI